MNHDEIEELIFRILATGNEEINCDQVFDLIARYVDMEVAGEEVAHLLPLVYEHLVQCEMCSDLHDTLHELAVMEEQDVLPDVDDLLGDILSDNPSAPASPKAESPGLSPTASPPRNSVEPLGLVNTTIFKARPDRQRTVVTPAPPASWLRWGWAAAAAVVVVVVSLGIFSWRQSAQVAQITTDENFIATADRAVSLHGTEEDPDAQGYLFIDEANSRGLLTIDGLNPLPAGHVYQMWFVTEAGTVSAGTFTVDSTQHGRVYVDMSVDPAEFTSLAITMEPKDGSSSPTTSPVCVWGDKQS
ncbi:MAG: anti-sigma factor [Anaerolineae bacterium]